MITGLYLFVALAIGIGICCCDPCKYCPNGTVTFSATGSGVVTTSGIGCTPGSAEALLNKTFLLSDPYGLAGPWCGASYNSTTVGVLLGFQYNQATDTTLIQLTVEPESTGTWAAGNWIITRSGRPVCASGLLGTLTFNSSNMVAGYVPSGCVDLSGSTFVVTSLWSG